MRKSRKTDFRQKNETSARLKITFVDMTYPGQRPELPSLSHHFFLVYKKRAKVTVEYLLYRTGSLAKIYDSSALRHDAAEH